MRIDTVSIRGTSSPVGAQPAAPRDRVTLGDAAPEAGVYADSHGRITHLALQLDGEVEGRMRDEVLTAWTKLFQAMDPRTRFTVVLENERDRDELERLLESQQVPDRGRFNVLVTDGLDITMWSRDQMLGLFTPGPASGLLAQTTMRPHGDDEALPPLIAGSLPGEVELDADKRLVTDGGDEVSNRAETFLGYNSLYLTAEKLYRESHPSTAATPFRYQLEMEGPIGKLRAPDFHYEPSAHFAPAEGIPDEDYWLGRAREMFEAK